MCLLNIAVLNLLNYNDNGQYFWTPGQYSTRVNILRYNGSYRFCIDYRKLNSNTIKDAYPLSRIDESLDQPSGSSLFSALDFCSGYWQVEMAQEDKPKTALQFVEDYSSLMLRRSVYAAPQQHLNALWKAFLQAFTGTYVSSN